MHLGHWRHGVVKDSPEELCDREGDTSNTQDGEKGMQRSVARQIPTPAHFHNEVGEEPNKGGRVDVQGEMGHRATKSWLLLGGVAAAARGSPRQLVNKGRPMFCGGRGNSPHELRVLASGGAHGAARSTKPHHGATPRCHPTASLQGASSGNVLTGHHAGGGRLLPAKEALYGASSAKGASLPRLLHPCRC